MTARFKEINQYGIAKIEFSEPVQTVNLNLSHINSSIVDFYIVPSNDWHKHEDNF
jgi:hypothetical protein